MGDITTYADLFKWIEERAAKGERCPTLYEIRKRCTTNMPLTELADMGLIRIEVYGRNWRVIEIINGRNAGARTKEAPDGWEPYWVSDKRYGLSGYVGNAAKKKNAIREVWATYTKQREAR